MSDDMRMERRRGPSTYALSFSGIIAVAGMVASGVATYNDLQNEISSLRRAQIYQDRTNERLSEEIKSTRVEHRETLRQINDRLGIDIGQGKRESCE